MPKRINFNDLETDVLSPNFEKRNWNFDPDKDYCSFSPDVIDGVDLRRACFIHDHRYAVGDSICDKHAADRELRRNIYKLGKAAGKGWRFRIISALYYRGVRTWLSRLMFWRGKDKP